MSQAAGRLSCASPGAIRSNSAERRSTSGSTPDFLGARVVWSLVCRLDLDAWLNDVKAIERHAGRNATDPRLLVAAPRAFATLRGVGSARELERLCENHLAYQWLCGGVSVNYHMLADFRSQGGEKWDELLTQIVATLMDEGLVTMDRVAQDGMRVRANAGQGSFRTGGRLEELLEEAKAQVETVRASRGNRCR